MGPQTLVFILPTDNCPVLLCQHFKLLLASSDPEIVVAALETLAALVKINPSKLHMNGKLINCGAINSHLLSLAQGWGSKEEGLGLFSCVVANERNQQKGCAYSQQTRRTNMMAHNIVLGPPFILSIIWHLFKILTKSVTRASRLISV